MKRDTILVSTFGAYLNEENLTDEFGDRTEVLEYALERGVEELMGVGSLDNRTVMFGRDYNIAEDLEEVEGVGEVIAESISGKKLLGHDAFDVSGKEDMGRAIGQAQSLAERALMADPDDYIETDLNQAVAIAKNTPQPDAVLIVTDGSTPNGLSYTVQNAVAAGLPVVVIDVRETVDWDGYFEEDESEIEDESESEAPAAPEPEARPDSEARAVANGD